MLKTYVEKVRNSKFFKDSFVTLFSTVVNRGLTFLIFFFLAKFLTVADYAELTIALALIMTLTDLVNTGLNASITRYAAQFSRQGDWKSVGSLFSTSLINSLLVSSLIIVLISVFSRSLSKIFFQAEKPLFLILASLGLFTMFLYSSLSALLQGLEKFKELMIFNNALVVLRLVSVLLMLTVFHSSLVWIVAVFVVTPVITFFIGLFLLRDIPVFQKYDPELLKKTFQFGKWMMLWAAVSVLQSRLDIYLLSPLAGKDQVSYFDIAQKFTSIVMMAFGAYGTVLTPKMAGITGMDNLKREKNKALMVSTLFSVLLALSALILPLLITLIFQDKYQQSVLPLKIMLVFLIPYVFALPFNVVLYSLGKSSVFFLSALCGLIVNLGVSLLLVPKLGAVGSSISFGMVNISGFVVSLILYKIYASKREE